MTGTPIFKILRDGRYGRFDPSSNVYEVVPREHVPPLMRLGFEEAKVKRELSAHDGKKPGEFASKDAPEEDDDDGPRFAPDDWRGLIVPDRVTVNSGWHEADFAYWDFYDDEGTKFEQSVRMESGAFTTSEGELATVYRWVSTQDGAPCAYGGWVHTEDQAREDGEEYAESEQMPEPEPRRPESRRPSGSPSDDEEQEGNVTVSRQARAAWTALDIGHDVDEAGDLFGAPSDASVSVTEGQRGTVEVEISHSTFSGVAFRTIGHDSEGSLYIRNNFFKLRTLERKKGLGLDIFARQVKAARAAGVSYISCYAARGGEYVGYYVWPRYGYDQSIDDFNDSQQKAIRKAWPEAESVLDIMATEEGRDWWDKNGYAMSHAVFDLEEGSRSLTVLRAYLKEKGKNGIRLSHTRSRRHLRHTGANGSQRAGVESHRPEDRQHEAGPTTAPGRQATSPTGSQARKLKAEFGGDGQRRSQLNNLLAMVEFQKAANATGDPTASQPYLNELGGRFKSLRMSWRADTTATGHVKAVGEGENAPTVLYGRDAEAALRNQEKKASAPPDADDGRSPQSLFDNAKLRTEEILSNVLDGLHTPDDLQELGSHLPLLQHSSLEKATSLLHGMGAKPVEAAKIMDEVRAKLDAADKAVGTEPVEPMVKGPFVPKTHPLAGDAAKHLDALANDASRPAAIKARSGQQHRSDAIRDALQGKHGPEVKKAVEKGASWEKNKVDKRVTGARHSAVAQELAKLKGQKVEAAEGPPEQMKGLTPEGRQIEAAAHKYARENYEKVRDQYLSDPENAVADPAGGFKSITLNTDEWRNLLPGYQGTNAVDVHEPASWLNKKLYGEALHTQAGKGNDTLMVLAGGGGSGKGTVFKKFYRKEDYPLVLDQVSDHLGKLEMKLDEAVRNGYKAAFVFVDRPPEAAWGGVVGRALDLDKQTGNPDIKARTVPLDIAVKGNINARRTALELLKKRPDIQAHVIDNTSGKDGERRLIKDRQEAVAFLQAELDKSEHALKHGMIDKLRGEVIEGHKSGKIPTHIAKGFLGNDEYFKAPPGGNEDGRVSGSEAVPADDAKRAESPRAEDDRRPQSRRTERDGGAKPPDERLAEGAAGRASGEGKAAGRGLDGYLSQAMDNLKKTSRTAGGVVDTSASAGKAAQMAEGLTGADAATHAINNFENAVRTVHEAATAGPQTVESVSKLADDLNRQVNKGIVKDGVLRRLNDSTKFPYTKVEDLPFAYKQFSKEFAKRLNDPKADPVETAAWVEWRANMADHFWADGVGKTAKALAMVPLMKAGLPLPNYPSNKEFFKYSQPAPYDPTDGPNAYLDEHWEKFRDFYKGLMPTEPTTPRLHEMTRDEFMKDAEGRFGPRGEKKGDTPEGQDWHAQHDAAADTATMKDVREDPRGFAHKAAVRAALAAGKPVSEAVLNEYPDLKPGKTALKPASAPHDETTPMGRFGKLVADTGKADKAYDALPESRGGKVINADTARDMSPEYAGSKADRIRYSGETAKHAGDYAYQRLQRELANRGDRKKLLITAGGPAAGKSSTLAPDAIDKADLVWDTTLQDAGKSREVLSDALQNGWNVDVNYTHASSDDWVRGLLSRTDRTGRWGKFEDAAGQHQRAQENVLAALKTYGDDPRVNIKAFHNEHGAAARRIGVEDMESGGAFHIGADAGKAAQASFEKEVAAGNVSPDTLALVQGHKSPDEVAKTLDAAGSSAPGPQMAAGIAHVMGEPTKIDAAGYDHPVATQDEAKLDPRGSPKLTQLEKKLKDLHRGYNVAYESAINDKGESMRRLDREIEGVHQEMTKERERLATPKPSEERAVPKPPADHQISARREERFAGKPHLALAEALHDKLAAGETIDAKALWAAADAAHGGTRAEGKYGPSDAYDALEAGFNKSLMGKTDPRAPLAEAKRQAEEIALKVNNLPTQTNRSGNKDSFQQFSTPPHYSYAAAWLANLRPGDVVLEPSAGTGCLAVQAANGGADVITNELDPKRADFLRHLFGNDKVHVENAEQIAGILPKRGVKPSVVIMNPPFSQTAGRMGDKKELLTGANHIGEAFRMLPEGGRLVAIVGRGMTPDSPTYSEWFDKIKKEGTLAANVGVNGREYKKYGTQFDTRMLVIDKTGAHEGETVTGDVDSIPELMDKLEGVRNARPEPIKPTSGEPLRGPMPGQAEGGVGLRADAPDALGDGVDGAAAGSFAGSAGNASGRAGASGGSTGSGGPAGAGSGDLRGGAGAASGPPGSNPLGSPGQPSHGSQGGANNQPGGANALGEPAQQPANGEPNNVGGGRTRGNRSSNSASQKMNRGFKKLFEKLGTPGLPQLRPAGKITVESIDPSAVRTPAPPSKEDPAKPASSQEDLGESLYEQYKPALLRIPGAHPHPTALVESAAMAAVRPPVPHYQPTLSPDVIEKGLITAAALESIVYAGQAHQQFLDHDENAEQPARRGYFIGDGTGTGKGRQIAGIIADNYNQGRKKHVWVSAKATLHEDASRDWRDIGMDPAQVHKFEKIRGNPAAPDDGIAFITYDTLKSRPKDPTAPSNLDELVKWLGPDFDGVIAFDEAHYMANSLSQKGDRGDKDASHRALAGVELQKRLPNARVTYVSATGATEVANLAYAERLGMWGTGTPFADKREFVNQMQQGGLAAMEAVAQSLKATGSYGARSLSFDDGTAKGRVTYEPLTHHLTPEQHEMYDTLATGWQHVLENIDKALEVSGGKESSQAKRAAKGQFWGAQQRFFNQLMTSMQTPSVIAGMEKDFAEGRAPVIQLTNTMEAAMNRGLARRGEGEDLESVDVSPREILMQYLEKSFPIHRYEKYVDANGNEGSRLVQDSNGDPVEDPQAVAMRDELLDATGAFKIPESPIDMIINHFGHDKIAEATGRTQRLVRKQQPDGTTKMELERRPGSANTAEAAAFQGGKKQALIFSDAGGTGRSYHADKNAVNQKQRVHYVLQTGWRADTCVQGFGRTHRTNQAIAPIYKLVQIDEVKAQKRFVSTIARRLDQLGALTRGQRQTGGGGLMSAADNLESPEATVALEQFFKDLEGGRIEGLSHRDVMKQMGLLKEEKEGEPQKKREEKKIPMSQFLNRLLSLRLDMQTAVFDEFDKRHQQVVERAVREGTLDTGVENYPADSIERTEEKTAFQDARTGAEAKLVSTIAKRKNTDKTSYGSLSRHLGFVRGKTSGKIWAVKGWVDKTNPKTGAVTKQVKLQGPGSVRFQDAEKVLPALEGRGYGSNYEQVGNAAAQGIWESQYDAAPDSIEKEEHFVTGAILPIWDKFPTSSRAKIYRIRTSDGQTMVGRHVPRDYLPQFRQSLGIVGDAKKYSAADAHEKLSSGRGVAVLSNGWRLKPVRVQNERRIELTGKDMSHSVAEALANAGAIMERINYETRFFVPTGPSGASVLDKILKSRNATVSALGE